MGDNESNGDAPVVVHDHEDALVKLMDQTGYTMVQENGQRKFGGPPPNWTGPIPKGSEVFVGKIPRDVFEDDLFPVFKQIGEIYEMRLMMDFSGCNRGFAFVTYANVQDAKKAINQLNNYEIRQGKYIGVVKSVDNCRLFVGSIPRTKTKEEIREEIGKVTDGVMDIILYNSPKDKTKNRGFVFVEYESHRAAAIARKKLLPGRITLWNQRIQVDWAEPEPNIDEDVMALVRVLYARNLMLSTSEETLKKLFEGDKARSVEKVKKMHDYAFIHFVSRDDAESAKERLNYTDVDGSIIEVVWAKPRDNASRYAVRLRGNYSGNYNNSNNFRFPGLNYNGGLDSHNIPFGMHPAQAGGHFIAYQSPNSIRGYSPHMASFRSRGGRGAAGLRGGRGYYQSNGSGRHQEFRYFDLPQSYSFMHANPLSMMRPHKLPNQMLAEICQKQGWGEPQYQVVPFGHGEGSPNAFQCKVIIPNWGEYSTNKSFRSTEEAKQYAVSGVLSQMNVPWEGAEIPTYFDMPQTTALFPMAGGTPVGPTPNF